MVKTESFTEFKILFQNIITLDISISCRPQCIVIAIIRKQDSVFPFTH